MRTPEKASLVLRVQLPNGKRTFLPPSFTDKGAIRPRWAKLNDTDTYFTKGTYYLRYTENGKKVSENVGAKASLAVTLQIQRALLLKDERNAAQVRRVKRLEAKAANLPTPPEAEEPKKEKPSPKRWRVYEAIIDFRNKKAGKGELKARKKARSYEQHLLTFQKSLPPAQELRKYVDDITLQDVERYRDTMDAEGKAPKTITNRLGTLRRLIDLYGGDTKTVDKTEKPRVYEREPPTYEDGQLARLLAASPEDERLVWLTFLGTGFREQEVSALTWGEVSFERETITLKEKPRYEFTIKSGKGRTIPIPSELIGLLKARHADQVAANPKVRPDLIFPNREGRPDGHFLRTLKIRAFRAGLNCGHCIQKQRPTKSNRTPKQRTCAQHPVCSHWQLHSFRRTAATNWIDDNISIQIVSAYLGHSKLDITAKYLGIKEKLSPENRAKQAASLARYTTAPPANP